MRETKGIIAVADRLGITTIYIDQSLSLEEQNEVTSTIKQILAENHIHLYNICTAAKVVAPLNGPEIGSKICGRPSYASLGAFLKDEVDKKTNDVYLLMSNHMSQHLHGTGRKELYLLDTTENLSPIGELLPFSESAYDVAVAKVKTVIQKDKSKFKTKEGKPVKCKIFEKKSAKGLTVHIWGASTSPGIGKITCDYFSFTDEPPSYNYIIVENCNKQENFCSEGDSGSIVLYNNSSEKCVNAISVLCGRFDPRGAAQPEAQYLTQPLKASLEDLSKRYGKKFIILNEDD